MKEKIPACKSPLKYTEPCSVDHSHIEALHSDGTDLYSNDFRLGKIKDVSVYTESRPFTSIRRDMTISLDVGSGSVFIVEFESRINKELFEFLKDWQPS